MADRQVSSQQANPILANTYSHPHSPAALHQLQSQNPYVAGDYQEVHREGVMQGEMQYPPHIDATNYNAAHRHPPSPPYPHVPHVPYVHMHRDGRVAEPVPAQAHPFAPEAQENYDGYGAHFPLADPPEAFSGVRTHPAPLADMPPATNGLRDLVGRFLNNPGTNLNMLRIEPGRNGRFEVWIALELADMF